MNSQDETFMEAALAEGRKNLGITAENPSVGCVIVRDGEVVGKAVTAPGGRPHAEVLALVDAGAQAKGATAYITLEPCAHHGQTPPCAEALVNAGIVRVVSALQDPDPRTAGAGHKFLRAAAIEVETGVLERRARRDLVGFLSRIERGRPYTLLKLAISRDGMIAAAPGEQTVITGKEVQHLVHTMRAEADAIMIGGQTARIDDPALTCRIEDKQDRSPARVIVTNDPLTLQNLSMLKSRGCVPVWFLTLVEGPHNIVCTPGADGGVDIADGLGKLADHGINRVLVEGGAKLATAMLQLGLIDEIALFTAPTNIGDGGVAAPLDLISGKEFNETSTQTLGDDRLTTYVMAL
jgi:diaminohydroxyphosphoribosylaminopyrimidine deaminase/5-amino-6-(5-phosphoribosylamino)uracil reductase